MPFTKFIIMNYILARFKSQCFETKKVIKRNDNCLYDPSTKKAYHMDSPTGIKWQEDEQLSHEQAGKMAQAEQEIYFDNFCQNNNI